LLYLLFALGCFYIYRTLEAKAGGAYDYLLTLSAGLQALAFGLLVVDTRSAVGEGLSEKALWAFLVAHTARISTTFWGEGYVPEDNTGDVYLYQTLEALGVALVAYMILKLSTVRTMHDVGQGYERWSLLIGMSSVAGVLAYFTKSTGHNDYFADLSWMFSVWLEAMALMPQVHLLWQGTTGVDESALHFAGFTLASAVIFALFWGRCAKDRYAEFEADGQHIFFRGVLCAAALRVGLCGVYFYLFMKTTKGSKGRGEYELCGQDEL
jgi:hypothetical protein